MSRIITISREFGSGGRELGKRLAEILKIAYYDQEIITGIAEKSGLAEEYVNSIVDKQTIAHYPITIGRTLSSGFPLQFDPSAKVYVEQRNIIENLASKGDCIIIGRCSDYILREQNPFSIFVHAGIDSRLRRCRDREPEKGSLSDSQLTTQILAVDKARAKYHKFFTGEKWGQKENYTLCINTSNTVIKDIVLPIAGLLKAMLYAPEKQ